MNDQSVTGNKVLTRDLNQGSYYFYETTAIQKRIFIIKNENKIKQNY